jgi:hypothetical protein
MELGLRNWGVLSAAGRVHAAELGSHVLWGWEGSVSELGAMSGEVRNEGSDNRVGRARVCGRCGPVELEAQMK